MGPQACQEAFDRYRTGLQGPEALLECLRQDGQGWLATHAPDLQPQDQHDLLQDALEAVLNTLPRFRGTAYPQLRAYFLHTLRSRLADRLRRRRRETVGLPPGSGCIPDEETGDLLPARSGIPDVSPGFEDDVTVGVDLQRLLSPEEYRVLRLKLEGYRDRDVARILRKAPGTVAALYHRARRKLQHYLPRARKAAAGAPPSNLEEG